jgi:hypothetical protein
MVKRIVSRLLGLIIDTSVGYRRQHLIAVVEIDRARKSHR